MELTNLILSEYIGGWLSIYNDKKGTFSLGQIENMVFNEKFTVIDITCKYLISFDGKFESIEISPTEGRLYHCRCGIEFYDVFRLGPNEEDEGSDILIFRSEIMDDIITLYQSDDIFIIESS
jgi:hypothetical protein